MFKQLTKILFLVAAIFILTFVGNPFPDFRQESAPSARAAAPSGSVLDFDGGDYLKVADSAVLDQGNRLTLSIWTRSDLAGNSYIIYRSNAYYLKLTSSCAIEGAIYYSAAWRTITSSAIPCAGSAWTHIEMTYDKDGGGIDELKLYINGVLSAVGDHSTAISDVATDLYIGSDSAPANYFDGKLDHFKLYQYARTSDEVLVDYNDGKAAHLGKNNQRDDGLVGYWNMEEGKGQTVFDRSGNANNGILGGTTAVQKSDPVFTSGYSSSGPGGTGLKFDGVDDYVNMSAITKQPITIAMWLKYNSTANQGFVNFSTTSIAYFGTSNIGTQPWIRLGVSAPYVRFTNISAYRDNNWHFWVLYLDPDTINNSWLKIDGNNIAQDIFLLGTGAAWNGLQFGNGFAQYNGSIDEVRIYNRALSADEIRQHYNQKKPALEWKFDEGSGTAVHDEGFNNYDGTLHE